MVKKDWSGVVKEKINKYSKNDIVFTKTKLLDWLCKRNNSTVEEMKEEILSMKDIAFTEKQQVEYEGKKEERFRSYFVYSQRKGKCYVLAFDDKIKVITVFPLGRTTLKKYKRRFK